MKYKNNKMLLLLILQYLLLNTFVLCNIDKYAISVFCVNNPDRWIFNESWASSQSYISKASEITYHNATQYQNEFTKIVYNKEIDYTNYWLYENPFEYFAKNPINLKTAKIFLIKFADTILRHRYDYTNRANTLDVNYTSEVEDFFMYLIKYKNSNFDLDSKYNQAIEYCYDIKKKGDAFEIAINNMYTERMIPKLFGLDYSPDIQIYNKIYNLYSESFLNKNIVYDQIIYYIQKKYEIKIDRNIIEYALDIYNYPFPYYTTYDKKIFKILDILIAGKFHLMSNTNDRDINTLSLWHTMHKEINRKNIMKTTSISDLEKENEKNLSNLIKSVSLNFKEDLSNYPKQLISHELEKISVLLLDKIIKDGTQKNVYEMLGLFSKYINSYIMVAKTQDRNYLIELISTFNDALFITRRATKSTIMFENEYLMPISIPREYFDLNNYLLVEAINNIKYVIREIDGVSNNGIYDELRFKGEMPYSGVIDPISIDGSSENSFTALENLVTHLKENLFVDIGNTLVSVFHVNQIESTEYNSCQFIITQYPEIIYAYKEIRSYLISTKNKNIKTTVEILHSILKCLTNSDEIDFDSILNTTSVTTNITSTSDSTSTTTTTTDIILEPFSYDILQTVDINVPESLCKGSWWELCLNTLDYYVKNTEEDYKTILVNLYRKLLNMAGNSFNESYVHDILLKISTFNEIIFDYRNRYSHLGMTGDTTIPFFKSEKLVIFSDSVLDITNQIVNDAFSDSKYLSDYYKKISKMIMNNNIKPDIFRNGIFVMPGNITECAKYFTNLSNDYGENSKYLFKRDNLINDPQPILDTLRASDVVSNNLSGDFNLKALQSQKFASRSLVRSYSANSVVPKNQPNIIPEDSDIETKKKYFKKDFYYYSGKGLNNNINSMVETKEKMISTIDSSSLKTSEKEDLKENLKKIHASSSSSSSKNQSTNPQTAIDLTDTDSNTNIFEYEPNLHVGMNKAISTIGDVINSDTISKSDDPKLKSELAKVSSKYAMQSSDYFANMVKQVEMAKDGIKNTVDKEEALKLLKNLKGPIPRLAEIIIKNDIPEKIENVVSKTLHALTGATLNEIEDSLIILTDSFSKVRNKREKRTNKLRSKYKSNQSYSRP